MIFRTESGSTYEIDTIADGRQYIQRFNPEAHKRADGVFVRLYSHYPDPIEVGSFVVLEMESLAGYGVDDYGTPVDRATSITTRTTTRVTEITE